MYFIRRYAHGGCHTEQSERPNQPILFKIDQQYIINRFDAKTSATLIDNHNFDTAIFFALITHKHRGTIWGIDARRTFICHEKRDASAHIVAKITRCFGCTSNYTKRKR